MAMAKGSRKKAAKRSAGRQGAGAGKAQGTQAGKGGKGGKNPARKAAASRARPKAGAKSAVSSRPAPRGPSQGSGKRAAPSAAKAPRPSEVKGQSVESYLARVGGWQAETLRAVHDLVVKAAPAAVHGLKWGMPFYEVDGPVLFTRAAKAHVSIGFWQGQALGAPAGLLEGSSRLQHLKLRQGEPLPKALPWLIRKAIALNRG